MEGEEIMYLIPEQRDWYLDQIEFDKKIIKSTSEAQKELSSIERYKASSFSNQDCATAAEQNFYETSLYYQNQANQYQSALATIDLPKPNIDSDVVEIGSYVTIVDTVTSDEETKVRTADVLLIEGELGNRSKLDIKCAGSEGAMGRALLGAHEGETVVFETLKSKNVKQTHNCEIVTVDNNFVYQRYADLYAMEKFDLLNYDQWRR